MGEFSTECGGTTRGGSGSPRVMGSEGDLVVMSLAAWERQQARLDLYMALDEAEADVRAGDRGISTYPRRRALRARMMLLS